MRIIILMLASLPLGACDPGQLMGGPFIKPGEWEITNGPVGDSATYKRCFTKKDIAKPELGVLNLDNPGCSRDKFKISAGKIRFSLACAVPSESTDDIRMRGEGRYDDKSFEITVTRSAAPASPAVIRGEWAGECRAE